MWQPFALFRLRAAMLSLESNSVQAGCAWACAFSSSDEFEAALIRAKLDAGAYGPKRRRRRVLSAGAATGVLAVLIWMI